MKTYSTRFLSPMLPSEMLKNRKRFGLINLYIGDLQHDIQHENAIYALFKPKFTVQYENFIQRMKKHPRFLELYGIRKFDSNLLRKVTKHIMIVFNIPGKYIKDYQKFLSGDYSKFSTLYGRRFTSGTNIYKVIHRNPKLKKHWESKLGVNLDNIELMAKPKFESEIFRYNKNNFKLVENLWKIEK